MANLTRRRTLCLAALAALPLLSACGGSSTPATVSVRSAPLQTMFEAQSQLVADPVGTLDRLRAMGVDSVRVFMPWASLAPDAGAKSRPAGVSTSAPAAYAASGWAPYDAIVRAAAPRHIAVDLTLEGPAPLWATGAGAPSASSYPGQWRPKPTDYGDFVHAVATRYSGTYTPPSGGGALPKVTMWSLWNEPNYGTQLAPQAIDNSTVESSPAQYRKLVAAAWSALRATGHDGDTVLIGELAPRGITAPGFPGNFSGMVPLRFLRALYCVNASLHELSGQAARERGCPTGSNARSTFVKENPALFNAGGFALHLYPNGAEPPNLTIAAEPDYADLATMGRFEHTLDTVMQTYGSSKQFPIYDTEFGYKTDPPYKLGAALPTAANYLNWSEYLHWRDPRLRSYDQYLLTDPTGQSKFATGLEFANGRAKPIVLAAFRFPIYLPVTTAKSGSALEVWGCLRAGPPVQARTGQPQQAKIEFAPHGGQYKVLRAVTVSASGGYFDVHVDVPASGTIRLAWTPPHGPILHSRSVAVTIR